MTGALSIQTALSAGRFSDDPYWYALTADHWPIESILAHGFAVCILRRPVATTRVLRCEPAALSEVIVLIFVNKTRELDVHPRETEQELRTRFGGTRSHAQARACDQSSRLWRHSLRHNPFINRSWK